MPALGRILTTGVKPSHVTMVIRSIPAKALRRFPAAVALVLLAALFCRAQPPAPSSSAGVAATQGRSAEALYLQLRSVGLDSSRVYNIRDVTLERAAVHVTFDDGTIAFTEDVAGHITGAFFEGEGEVLLVPRDQMERASMTLFTGAAILEERFITAYFRFNDDTFAELKASLQ